MLTRTAGLLSAAAVALLAACASAPPPREADVLAASANLTRPVLPPRDEWTDARAVTGTWRGTYVCWQGETGLELTLEGRRNGTVEGVFRFFPLPGNPDRAAGSYRVRGAHANGNVVLEGVEWMGNAPEDYIMVGLDGLLGAGGQQFEGTVPECEAPFRVRR